MKLLYCLLLSILSTSALFSYDAIDVKSSTNTFSEDCSSFEPEYVYQDKYLTSPVQACYDAGFSNHNAYIATYYRGKVSSCTPVNGQTYNAVVLVDAIEYQCITECDDEVPDGWLTYPKNPVNGACADYESPLTEQFSQRGVAVCNQCFAPPYDETTCQAPKVLDTSVHPATCSAPALTCDEPNQVLNEDSTACVCASNFINYLDRGQCLPDSNGDGTPDFPSSTDDSDGDGTPDIQDPDSAFYGLCTGMNKFASATYYGKKYTKSYYDFKSETKFEFCGDYVGTDTTGLDYVDGSYDIPDTNPSCIQKYCFIHNIDKQYFKSNPCDEEFDRVEPTCDVDEVISGYAECTHNGLTITNDTIKCIKINDPDNPNITKPSDCDNNWYETYNTLTKQCMCDDGYSRNKWGICAETLDANATLAQIENKKSSDKQDAVIKNQLDNNSTFSSSNSNKSIFDSLSGIRRDNNLTNGLLSSINDKLDNNNPNSGDSNSTLDNSDIPKQIDENIAGVTDFLNTVKGDVTNIKNSFDSTKDFISDPFSMTITNKACEPFVISAFGKTVSLDLYTFIGIVRAPLTFILTVIIYFLSIKIYIKGLGLKND